jgi:hypothetical protein
VAVGVYWSVKFGMAYRTGHLMADCLTPDEQVVLNEKSRPDARWLVSVKGLTCYKAKQNFADRMFFKVPDRWLDPTPPAP